MSADWSRLTEHLRRQGDRVTLTWEELDRIVGGLPRSATDHQAFWSGDRPHSRAWQKAGFERGEVVRGVRVTLHRRANVVKEDRVSVTTRAVDPGPADLLLVTCVKEKLDRPAAARDLYVSPLFRKERAYAELSGLPWFILSAEHGLVAPDDWLAPYERYLPDTSTSYRTAWGAWVVARLALLTGPLTGRTVEVHASKEYVAAVRGPLIDVGARLTEPLAGLALGERLAWYGSAAAPTPSVEQVVAVLGSDGDALSPATFRAEARETTGTPGLYSWWVDASGAADLTAGLGHRVDPGLIYAGLAGAARAGEAPRSTLWSRITGNHLGGGRTSSTFRKTLGAVLDSARGEPVDRHALTAWMHEHLRLVTHSHPDAFTLGALETDVLLALDPPLNLDKVGPSPLRTRLRELRANDGSR